jgi:hypothetical protein
MSKYIAVEDLKKLIEKARQTYDVPTEEVVRYIFTELPTISLPTRDEIEKTIALSEFGFELLQFAKREFIPDNALSYYRKLEDELATAIYKLLVHRSDSVGGMRGGK